MDKKKLNNEIVLCRPLVRKAKVIIIRKILKKIKLLKSCKKESVKEKKLKKAERLFKKVQILKKLKVDDVTKFALRNKELNISTKKPLRKLKILAFSSLAKYDLLAKKIQSIREEVPNWEIELPLLLDSIGTKKKNKKAKVNNVKSNTVLKLSDEKSNDVEIGEDVKSSTFSKFSGKKANDIEIHDNIIKIKEKKNQNTTKSDMKLSDNSKTFIKNKIENVSSESHSQSDSESVSSGKNEEQSEAEKIVKIEDPFFVGKKIIASKLLLEENQEELPKKFDSPKIFRNNDSFNFESKPYRNKFDSDKGFRDKKSFNFNDRPFQKKFDSDRSFRDKKSFKFNDKTFHKKFDVENVKYRHMSDRKSEMQESLHPSWEAKKNQKAQLVVPFQGKKTKFSEE